MIATEIIVSIGYVHPSTPDLCERINEYTNVSLSHGGNDGTGQLATQISAGISDKFWRPYMFLRPRG